MLRFASNRWWAFVLALSLFLVCATVFVAQTPRVAYATQFMGEDPSDPPQPGIGDPDVPITPGAPRPGKAVSPGSGSLQAAGVERPVLQGESTVPVSVWAMRLRLYLMGFRIRLLL